MTKEKFWELVEEVNWKEISKENKINFDKLKLSLLIKMSPIELAEFRKLYAQHYKLMSNAVSQTAKETNELLSDDSYGDLVAHIIGLGEDVYNESLNSIDLIKLRIETIDYEESFEYVVPCLDDYASLSLNTYASKAFKYIEETEDLEEKDKLGDQKVVDEFLEKVYKQDLNNIEILADRVYDYWYSKEGREAGLQVHDRYCDYGVPNLASDIIIILPIFKRLNK